MITYGGYNHASSRIRGLNYIKFIENRGGYVIKWIPRAPDRKAGFIHIFSFAVIKRLLLIKRIFFILLIKWDCIYVQRVFLDKLSIQIIRWKKISIIYDFDDAIYLGEKRNSRSTILMIKSAESIAVANPLLAAYCRRFTEKNIKIIPSPVDTERITPAKNKSEGKIVIGWVGSLWTEKYLNILKSVFEKMNNPEVELLLVGTSGSLQVTNLTVNYVNWSYEKEVNYLQQMDIGIMPLFDDEWSRGKGGYKLYQYMAAGIPLVASPIGINKEIVDHGENGFLATSNDEWLEYLNKLVGDPELRINLGRAGRKKAEDFYSYQSNADKLVKMLNEVVK